MKKKISLLFALILMVGTVCTINMMNFPVTAASNEYVKILEKFDNIDIEDHTTCQFKMRTSLDPGAYNHMNAVKAVNSTYFARGKSMKFTFGSDGGDGVQLAYVNNTDKKNWSGANGIQLWIYNKSDQPLCFKWARACPNAINDSDGGYASGAHVYYPLNEKAKLYSGGAEVSVSTYDAAENHGFSIPENFCGILRLYFPENFTEKLPSIWGFAITFTGGGYLGREVYIDDVALFGDQSMGGTMEKWDDYVKNSSVKKYFNAGGVVLASVPSTDSPSFTYTNSKPASSSIPVYPSSEGAANDGDGNGIFIVIIIIAAALVAAVATAGLCYYFIVLKKKGTTPPDGEPGEGEEAPEAEEQQDTGADAE